ncbi:MAG TPA: S9 family peptidase [Gemmataceae bacterium]|nr:S9 family peptidase [Gemmataceae bacterium]
MHPCGSCARGRPCHVWVALVLVLLHALPAFGGDRSDARRSIGQVMDALATVHRFQEVAISPKGKRMAWVEFAPNQGAAPGHSAIYMADVGSPAAAPRRISAGGASAHPREQGLAWSPDGGRLAFLSDADKSGQLQIYAADSAGGVPGKLTSLTGVLAQPRWSPDASRLAFLFTENAPRALGPTQAAAPDSGVIGESNYEQRLAMVETATGNVRLLSPPDLYVYEFDWSPDGKTLAAIAAHGSGDNNWYIAQLYTLAVASGRTKSILKPAMQIAVPRWSPDGTSIAFIGGLMSDEGVIGGDIFTIPATGGPPRNLTAGRKASVSWLTWLSAGNQMLFTEYVDGSSGIAKLDAATERSESLWVGPETITGEDGAFNVSLSSDGKLCALVRQSFQRPPEVWAGPIGAWNQVTHGNDQARPAWGEAKSIHWSSDGFDAQGWLVCPENYDRQLHYPMVVSVHGGPAYARRPTWPATFLDSPILAHQGYFVFYPNPRGSYGQGEAFTRANVKDLGHGDLRDILRGVDQVVKSYPVDNDRLGIGGWSYGGYMTMWAVTQTNRFRAAVAGAGIANWQSYYGENGIDQWMIPYFGASVYDDPAIYARSSPLTFIKRVKTPTLILVGDRDVECPVPQSYEFWHALKTLGVPTRLVIYPNEGHGIAQAKHRRDIFTRSLEWFDRHLGDRKPGDNGTSK